MNTTTVELCIFRLVYVTNFSLNWKFRFSGPNLSKKGIFGGKQKKSASPLNCAYSNYSRYKTSAQTDNFDFSVQICPPKKYFRSKMEILNTTIEFYLIKLDTKVKLKLTILIFWNKLTQKGNHKLFLHIQIGLGTTFQLRLTILIFYAKFSQRGCFRSKTENSHLWVCS